MNMVWLIIIAIIAAIVWPPLRISSRLSREEEEQIGEGGDKSHE
jgi:type II secretory pathway pseudopilin PulG